MKQVRTLEKINQEYMGLCAEFGHITLSKRELENKLQKIEAAITMLSQEATALKEQEAKNATSPQGELKTEEEPES